MGEPGERCDAGDLSGGVTGRGASMGLASEDMTADAEVTVTLDTHTHLSVATSQEISALGSQENASIK